MAGLPPLYALDGDTAVTPQGESYRLAGVDAPEMGKDKGLLIQREEPGAQAARDYLQQELGAATDMTTHGTDSYGRTVASFDTPSGDLGTQMVRAGVALPTLYWQDDEKSAAADAAFVRNAAIPEAKTEWDYRMEQARRESPYRPNLGMVKDRGYETPGTFSRAMSRGTDTMQAGYYAAANAIGELTGIDTMARWGEAGMKENLLDAALNPAEVETWDDADTLGKIGTKVIEAVGEQVPNLATMVAGGGAPTAAAKALIQGIGKAALKKLAMGGAGAVTYPQHVGEMQIELKENGIDSPGTALLTAIPNTALDVFGLERVLSTAFKGLDTNLGKSLVEQMAMAYEKRGLLGAAAKGGKAVAGQAARGAGMGFLAEAPTEALQEMVNITARAYHDPSFDPFGDEAVSRVKEAFLTGGVVGGVMGGAGRAAGTSVNLLTKTTQDLANDLDQGNQPPADTPPPGSDSPLGPAGTVPERLTDLRNQLQGYRNRERGPVFVDMPPNHPTVDALAEEFEMVPVEGVNGTYLIRPDDVDSKDLQLLLRREKAQRRDPDAVQRAQAAIIGYAQAKPDIDPATARVRETTGTDGTVIQQELVDDNAPPMAQNQAERPLETALQERAISDGLQPYWEQYQQAYTEANPGQDPAVADFLDEFIFSPREYMGDEAADHQVELAVYAAKASKRKLATIQAETQRQQQEAPGAKQAEADPLVRIPVMTDDEGLVYIKQPLSEARSELSSRVNILSAVLECLGS